MSECVCVLCKVWSLYRACLALCLHTYTRCLRKGRGEGGEWIMPGVGSTGLGGGGERARELSLSNVRWWRVRVYTEGWGLVYVFVWREGCSPFLSQGKCFLVIFTTTWTHPRNIKLSHKNKHFVSTNSIFTRPTPSPANATIVEYIS